MQCQPLSLLSALSPSWSAACQVWLTALTKKGKECVGLASFSQLSRCSILICVPTASAGSTGSRGMLNTFSPEVQRECEARFQSFARSINPGHYLRTTHWALSLHMLHTSWQSSKPRQFITGARSPLRLLSSRILTPGSSSSKSGRTLTCSMAPHGLSGVRWGLLQ